MEGFYTAARLRSELPNLTVTLAAGHLSQAEVVPLVVVLGSSVSLVALIFAFITYSLFSDMRTLSGTSLMNLLAALFMEQLLFVVGVGGVQDDELCVALAFSLLYIRLTVLCWLVAIAHDMYCTFRDNVNLVPTFNPNLTTTFFKYSLFGWGSPLFLLAGATVLHLRESGWNLWSSAHLKPSNCWFLGHEASMYGFLFPMLSLLLINAMYLIKSAFAIRYTVSLQVDRRVRERMQVRRRLQLCLAVRVTIIVSLVALLASLSQVTACRLLWPLFNVAHSLQGIVVAVCVTCNCHVLKIYTRSLKPRAPGPTHPHPVYRSTSMQLLTWEEPPETV